MADSFQLIKKNAGWYTLSMLVTGTTAFAAIVISKRWLSPELFIQFNLKLNAIFMVNSVCLSWITLSIFRMQHIKKSFFGVDNLFVLGLGNAILLSVPSFLVWVLMIKPGGGLVLPLAFLLIATLHALLLVSNQAALKANTTAIAETIRGAVTLGIMLFPALTGDTVTEDFFWLAWILAYLLSLIFLLVRMKGDRYFLSLRSKDLNSGRYRNNLREILRFGMPFTVWMLFSYLLSYSDRWYLAASAIPKTATADYLALADSIFRGCGFLFVPLNTSGYPVVSRLFDSGDMQATYKLIIKIVKTELLLLAGALIVLLLMHNYVFALLRISADNQKDSFILMIVLMVVHGLWQTCSMIQKPAELRMKTGWLAAGNAFGTTIAYLLFYFVVKPQTPVQTALCLSAGILFYTLFVALLLRRFLRRSVKTQQ